MDSMKLQLKARVGLPLPGTRHQRIQKAGRQTLYLRTAVVT